MRRQGESSAEVLEGDGGKEAPSSPDAGLWLGKGGVFAAVAKPTGWGAAAALGKMGPGWCCQVSKLIMRLTTQPPNFL